MADSDIFVSNDVQLDVDFGAVYVVDQGVVTKVVAKKYDPTKTYVVGEYVIYQEKLYKCNTAIEEPEEFDAEKWNNVLLADEVQIANANIALKANASDVYAKSETYNKNEVNTALESKADTATTYTKTEVDTALGDKADKSDTYTKTEVDTALSAKANSDDVYAKTDTYSKDEIDTNIYTKSETYNKNEVDGIINNLPAPMIFKGTLGVNGTITTLPTASSDNEGYTYKVITDGTYASQTAKVGDIFTSNGSAWVHIPSGDETFTDTWRSIKVNGTEKLSGSITSGSVDFKNGTNSTAVFDPSDNSIKFNVDGYTQSQVDTKLSAKANQADVTTALNNKADKSTTYTKTEVNTALALKADKSTTYTKSEVDNLVNLIDTVGPADICTFETTLPEPLQSVIVDVEATGGNGTPDNPNPINGYTEANITRCGVNLLPLKFYKGLEYNSAVGNTFDTEEDTSGTISGNTVSFNIGSWGRKCMLSPKLPTGVDFRLSMTVTSSASALNYTEFYLDKDLKVTRKHNIQNSDTSRVVNAGFNLNEGECYIAVELGCNVSATITFDSPQLELGSTATSYAPYNDNTYTIAFGQTVYDGVLDVTRGKLTVTKKVYDLSVESATSVSSGRAWRYNFPDVKKTTSGSEVPYFLGEQYRAVSANAYNYVTGTAYQQINSTSFDICNNDAVNKPDGLVVIELATPFDIDLTPEVISAIVGTNNVFADCGETAVEFVSSNAEDTVDIAKSVIEQTNLSDLADIPNPPTTDGTYRLKVTIANGKATYSWEEIT